MSDPRHENRLLDAVDDLTKSRIEHMTQTADDGSYVKAHSVEHPALLHQLRDAVNPSSNTAAGSSSLKSTRNLIDSDALFEYGKMTAAIGDWCRIVNIQPTREPVADLRQWYIAYDRTGADDQWYISELRRWANLIRNILEPLKRIEVTTPCPVCGKRTWLDLDGKEMIFPVVIQYRLPKTGEAIHPNAICRACETVWEGIAAVEELGEELNERHAG